MSNRNEEFPCIINESRQLDTIYERFLPCSLLSGILLAAARIGDRRFSAQHSSSLQVQARMLMRKKNELTTFHSLWQRWMSNDFVGGIDRDIISM